MNYLFSLLASTLLFLAPDTPASAELASDRSPYQLDVNSCGTSNSDISGTYVLTNTSGDSECDCWAMVGYTDRSLGKYQGKWMFFATANCQVVVNKTAPLGNATSCDPSGLSCITEAPLVIQNCGPSTGAANGTYVKSSTSGDSDCDCWNMVGYSDRSFGQIGGEWMFFATANCKAVVGKAAPLGTATGCEPSELSCISY
ncbi:MAG: hypothetical protein AAFV07_10660 [Bacteroidota bacterium]